MELNRVNARLSSIDAVRGLVMVIMALDHTRDWLHVSALAQDPTDLATTTPWVFFTRWVTHFCAPTFVFLAGVSAYLTVKKTDDTSAARSYLWRRGLWLILLEFTLVNFAIWFDPKFRTFLFQVIGAIGFGFIVLSLLVKLSPKVLGIIGVIIVAGHNLLPLVAVSLPGWLRPLFGVTVYQLPPQITLVIGYPPIPWLGIMLLGFAAGTFFARPSAERKSLFLKMGLAMLALFTVLRLVNVYGNPVKWSVQRNSLFTLMSFLNVLKYPPSLLFALVMLGGMFLALAWAEGRKNRFSEMLSVYGRVPLFYYLLHLYLIHLLMFVMVFGQGFGWADLEFGFNFGRPKNGSGFSLGIVYLVWLGAVAALYPLCQWYGNYKARHRENRWLRYL